MRSESALNTACGDVADLKSPVLKRSSDVPGFEQWIIRKNFLAGCSGSKQVKHVPNPDA
jgi:hypothetical protein